MAAADHKVETTRLTLLGSFAGYFLRRASQRFAAGFADTVGPMGMRQVLFGVLTVIHDNPGIRQGAAGEALGIQRANMVSLVNELVDRGLVERRVSESDRRAFALELTPAGKVLVEQGVERIRGNEDELLAPLTPTERRTLLDLLSRLDGSAG
ncbi:MarR family winged helix-turn-helix transcriptional regulator [Sphingomonas yantingensis]|uniref:DNA-binding MarR family transcriptional regulator n=1 Tax=Sphingomonas yantingensis TaxID=1241761 RepID=A0A7W9ANF6_9SPHN|nr:MarR family transcriptional regulator [Sphingomonas yantingensis]MBB5697507.1 DNA-binding MarR family transcriptional regulator [Sphingomonas yantingensis]